MKKIVFILLLLAVIWWMWHCVYGHNEQIEADVTERAGAAFSESKLSGSISDGAVDLKVDGRDVILTGVVNSMAEKATLLKIAHDTYGVARVFDELTIAEAPEPEPVVEKISEPASAPVKTCFSDIPAWMNAQKISFASAQAVINAKSYDILTEMAAQLEDCPGVMISVAGHTDSDGSEGLNQTLSANRAAAVVSYLQGKGLDQEMRSVGYGESQPVASNATGEGKAQNRRVVFEITEKN